MTPVCIVEDMEMIRDILQIKLQQIEGISRTGSFDSAEGYLKWMEFGPYGVRDYMENGILICDLHMPGMGGMSLIQMHKDKWPNVKIMVISSTTDDLILESVIRNVDGFVSKFDAANCIDQAVKEITQGNTYISPTVWQEIKKKGRINGRNPLDALTVAQREVMCHVFMGLKGKAIAVKTEREQSTVSEIKRQVMENFAPLNLFEIYALFNQAGVCKFVGQANK